MDSTPLSAGALTALDAALAMLLDRVEPIAPALVPLDLALGRIAAALPALGQAHPASDTAAMDGWACRALDLVGASAYSPLALAAAPAWVEVGDAMPDGCDCVLEADLVDRSGPIAHAVGEATPAQGVRRAGEDIAADSPPVLEGKPVSTIDLFVARKLGLTGLPVRAPRGRLIDVAAGSGETVSTLLLAESLKSLGAELAAMETVTRDAAAIAAALDGEACDLILLVGGTGDGRTDVTAEALSRGGVLLAHRIALRPGRAAAIGRLGATPVVALPGSPDQSFGAFLALVQPLLDRLTGRSERLRVVLPLSRKIASTVGIAEIALLRQDANNWAPLAVGDLSIDAVRMADAWLVVPGDSEGYAAGTPIGALPLRAAG